MKKIISIILVLVLLVGCSKAPKETKKEAENKAITLKVGLTGSDSKVWRYIAKKVKEKGINLELVFFDDYTLPNAALSTKQIDLNAFQHYSWLNKEIENLGYKLSVIGDTVIAPIGLYSKTLKSVAEIKDNSKVAIPDDPTNGGRALKLLEQAGLIKVDPKVGVLPTVKDIIENPKNLKIIEIAATNIPPVLDELPIAVINSGVAIDAGLNPVKDSLELEKVDLNAKDKSPYINVIAVRTEDKDKEVFKKILDVYYTDEVKKIIEEETRGASIPVWK